MKEKQDRYSPNAVLAACIVAAGLLVVICGKTLWVPASRVENLYLRSIVLAAADAGSAFASWTGCDGALPAVRTAFLDSTGLSTHVDWDTRYFNTRDGTGSAMNLARAGAQNDSASAAGSDSVEPSASDSADATAIAESPVLPSGTCIDIRGGPTIFIPDPESSANGVEVAGISIGDGASIKVDDLPLVTEKSSPAALLSSNGASSRSAARNTSLAGRSPLAVKVRGFAHSSKNPLNVFMFGDSQVFSLGSGLSRLTGKDGPIAVDFLPVHSSGFIRGDYFNWPSKLEDTFTNGSYEAGIMMLGMNDYQNFWSDAGKVLKKRTPEWEAAYKQKCRSIIDIALASVPRLYWVGMPVVRNDAYSESLAYIDSVQDSLAAEYSPDVLVRISLKDTIPGSGQKYADSVEFPKGKKLRVMSEDGSHFTVEGGQLAMKPLFDRLSRDYLFSEVPVAHLPE
jgi:hypothetical protein